MSEHMEQMNEYMGAPDNGTEMVSEFSPDAPAESVDAMSGLVTGKQTEGDGQDGPQQEEALEKPKRRSRKRKEELPEEVGSADGDSDFQPESTPEPFDGEPGGYGADESVGEDDLSSSDDDPQSELTEPVEGESRAGSGRISTRRVSARAVTLDSSGNVIRERMRSDLHDLAVLTAARNARRILTATVDAIETDGEALPRMVFYVGMVKVMIPFQQMGLDLDPALTSQREARLLIDSMLGAKIDYMVRGVDTEARIAAASRRDAMLVRQRTILNARGTNQEFRINEGMRVTARILHVSQYAVRVEVYGFECYVPIGSISNLWVSDVREVIQVGEERPVEIVSLKRDEDGRVVSMRVSMRAAEDAPQLELREGNTYTGHIVGFTDRAYFIRTSGMQLDIRCPVKSNHTMELLSKGDLVKFYVRGIHDGVPTGAILKVLKKKHTSEF